MSELRVESRVHPSSWNDSLCACHGTVFHAAEWARYVQTEQVRACPEFFTLVNHDGSIAGQALGFHSASPRNFAASFTGRRWLDALPAVINNSPATLSMFLSLIADHAHREGDVTFEVGSFASRISEAVLKPLEFTVSRRLEFELDLAQDEKSLWEAIDVKRRPRIRKAMKAGVEVRELSAAEGVSHLRRLQAASSARIVQRGGPPISQSESGNGDPTTALTSVGLGRIVGGFVDGVCVSASFFTTFNGMAYYALSGHDKTALDTHAPSLLLWEMALRFKGEGIQRLNLGGCGIDALEESSPEHGVYVYKKSFGGAILECANGEKVLRPAIRRAANLLRAAIR